MVAAPQVAGTPCRPASCHRRLRRACVRPFCVRSSARRKGAVGATPFQTAMASLGPSSLRASAQQQQAAATTRRQHGCSPPSFAASSPRPLSARRRQRAALYAQLPGRSQPAEPRRELSSRHPALALSCQQGPTTAAASSSSSQASSRNMLEGILAAPPPPVLAPGERLRVAVDVDEGACDQGGRGV